MARVSATLRQLPIDDLVGEDVKQHRRTRRVAAAAAVALMMLLVGSVVGALIAIQQRNLAREQQRVAEEQREESRQRLVRLMVENGVRLLDERDLSGSALWFAEAVRLEAGLPGQDLQRLRLRAALMQHPRLVQMWSTEREIGSRTLGNWVTFGRTDRYAVTNAVEGDLVPREGGFGTFDIAPALEPRLWDTTTGRRVPLRLPAEGQRLLAIDAAADRLVIATAGEGGVRTWDGASGAPLAELPHPCAVSGADFSGDGRAILTDCDDGILRVWDPAGPTLLASLPHSAAVTFAWMTSDRRRVLVGTADNTAHMWTIGPQGRMSHVEIPHGDELQEVHVGLDGRRVFTLASYQARLWEIDNAGQPTLLKTTIDVNHIDVSPDGRYALLATGYGEALMWGLETANESFTVAHDDVVFDAAFSPDGRRFATASRDRTARVWDANSGAPLAAPLHHEGAVSRVDFSAQHARLATITENEIVRVWDLEGVPAHEHESIGRAAFLADGKHLMTVSSFEVKSWDAESWRPVSIVPGRQVHDASPSPDGRRIATATEDGVVRIWNAATGAELQSLRHGRRARQAVFSPDGRRLASAGQIEGRHEVAIWDLATGAKSFTLPHGNEYIDHIDFAPGSARLLTIASRNLRVWDLERRQEIAALSIADAEQATFDTTGARLAIAERAAGVLVVDVTSGKRICPRIQLDNFRVSALAFTPDGRTLAVATRGRVGSTLEHRDLSAHDATVRAWANDVRAPLGDERRRPSACDGWERSQRSRLGCCNRPARDAAASASRWSGARHVQPRQPSPGDGGRRLGARMESVERRHARHRRADAGAGACSRRASPRHDGRGLGDEPGRDARRLDRENGAVRVGRASRVSRCRADLRVASLQRLCRPEVGRHEPFRQPSAR